VWTLSGGAAGSGSGCPGEPAISADLDQEVVAFRDRPLSDVAFPYVFLDVTCCKVTVNGRVVSQAVVIASGSETLQAVDDMMPLRAPAERGTGSAASRARLQFSNQTEIRQ
jgi:hypothetical protein